MKMNMQEWKNHILASDQRLALPIMTYPGMELLGKKVSDVIHDGEQQFRCMESLVQKYPSLAAVTIMDLSVEAEAFGSEIRFSEHEVPAVIGSVITDMAEAEAIKVPAVADGRTRIYLQAAELAAERITDRPVLGGQIGPFSLAGRLMDMTEIMITMMEEPEVVHTVLQKCTNFLISYAAAFKATGANGIIIAEPAAGIISPAQCAEFSSPYVKQIVAAVQDDYFMVVLHNCGNTVKQVSTLVSTGAAAFHFGNAVNMRDILPQVPADRLALGNIEPAGVFRNGTVQDMEDKVWNLLQDMKQYKNFILSSGCDVPPRTPLQNVDAFYRTLKKYNNQ